MIIDSHIHLNDMELSLLPKTGEGFRYLNCSVSFTDSERSLEMARKTEGIYAAAGIHPLYIKNDTDAEGIAVLVSEGGFIAIGEAGLDYRKGSPERSLQIRILEEQVALAESMKLPVILHCVRASGDILRIIKTHPHVRYIWHGFYEGPEVIKKLMDRDVFFGIGGSITFAERRKLRRSLSMISLDRILLETDAPYLKVSSGNTDYRCSVGEIISSLSEAEGLCEEEMEQMLWKNSVTCFGFGGSNGSFET